MGREDIYILMSLIFHSLKYQLECVWGGDGGLFTCREDPGKVPLKQKSLCKYEKSKMFICSFLLHILHS